MVLGVDYMLVSLGWGVEQPKVYLVLLLLSITHWSSKKNDDDDDYIDLKKNGQQKGLYNLLPWSTVGKECSMHIAYPSLICRYFTQILSHAPKWGMAAWEFDLGFVHVSFRVQSGTEFPWSFACKI